MKAHTAEHIFARSLQNLGVDIFVRKTEENGEEGKIYIRPKIEFEKIKEAELNVNKIISQDLEVGEEIFPSLSEAKKAYPNLRYNWERLSENQQIRVIKIGDFDVAACSREHSKRTSELKAFSIKSYNYKGDETIIEFLVGESAITETFDLKNKYVELVKNYNTENIDNYIKKLQEQLEKSEKENIELLKQASKFTNIIEVDRAMKYLKNLAEIMKNKEFISIIGKEDILIASKKDLGNLKDIARDAGLKGVIKSDLIAGEIKDKVKLIDALKSYLLPVN